MLGTLNNDRPGRGRWTAPAGVFAFALALRLGVPWALGYFARVPDSYREYLIAGQTLAHSGVFGSPFVPADVKVAPSAVMPPLYTGITAAALWFFGGETPAAIAGLQLLNALATSAAAALACVLGRRLGGHRGGLAAGALVAINPMLIEYSAYIWDTALFTLGVAVTIWLVLRLEEKPLTMSRFFAFGLWLGVLALLNPALTSTYPVLVLWPLLPRRESAAANPGKDPRGGADVAGRASERAKGGWTRPVPPAWPARWRQVGLCTSAAVAGWLIAIGPWTLRNHAQFDRWFYIRCGLWHELWLGVCPEADANPRAVFGRQFVLLNEDVMRRATEIGDFALFDEFGVAARAAVRQDPIRYLRLSAMRLADYWAGTIRTHTDAADVRWFPSSPLRLGTTLFMLAESTLAATALVVCWRSSAVRRLALCCALFSLVYVLTHVMIRYRAPSEPMMALLVGMLIGKAQLKSPLGAGKAQNA